MSCERVDRNIARSAPKPVIEIVIAIALVLLVSIGCSQPPSTATPIPTPTAMPTPPLTPTATPTPTLTPVPTPTAIPSPAPTPTAAATIPTSTATPTTPPTPQTCLEIALSWVPSEYADVLIEFADHAASRTSTGLEDARGYEDYEELDEWERNRFYGGVGNAHRDLSGWASLMPEKYGFDPWAFDLGVWAPIGNRPTPRFLVTAGGLDAATVREKLEGFGQQEEALAYEKADYKGTTYYIRSEDYLFPLRTDPPFVNSALNRVLVENDRILAAPATFIIEDLIDVREGDAPSLLESEAHLSLAREVGEGLIGGVFITPAWIAEHCNWPLSRAS